MITKKREGRKKERKKVRGKNEKVTQEFDRKILDKIKK